MTSEFEDLDDCLNSGRAVVELLERLGVVSEEAVTLHIGCGLGRVELHLCKRVRYCYGVDISPSMIEKAREVVRAENVEFVCNDGKNLSRWEESSLDLIYSFLVFQHLPRDCVQEYFVQAFAKLRFGSRIVFQIPIDETGYAVEPPASHPYGLRYYRRHQVRGMLARAGFSWARAFQAKDGALDNGHEVTDLVFVAEKPRDATS